MARRRLLSLAAAAVSLVTLGLTACDGSHPGHHAESARPSAAPSGSNGAGPTSARPNIVFVLTDDLTWNLVQYMPHLRALQQAGMTFTNYTVTDSLCCPSRASIFTGEFPHNTHVIGNDSPDGGFTKFKQMGEESHTFATSLEQAGYRTALVGKYLNHYEVSPVPTASPFQRAYVPPGWTDWRGVDSHGYDEYGYAMADNTSIDRYGHAADDYFTDVGAAAGQGFIRDSVKDHKPFFLEFATFAPHAPSVPAPQDAGTFAGITAPRTKAFGVVPRNAPPWLKGHTPLDAAAITAIDRAFEKRVESVQAVDRAIGRLETTLRRTGQSNNTVFVFSSDNGFHLGEYTLRAGKQTAFDTDVLVPLVVSGPGIPAGTTNAAVTENIDLAPTFDELAGATAPAGVDGHSLVALLHGRHPPWRRIAGIEHHKPQYMLGDPDRQTAYQGVPPSYDAIRSSTFTYVRYLDGEREYYDRQSDPYELDNIYASLPAATKAQLDRWVGALTTCRGEQSCWSAGLAPT